MKKLKNTLCILALAGFSLSSYAQDAINMEKTPIDEPAPKLPQITEAKIVDKKLKVSDAELEANLRNLSAKLTDKSEKIIYFSKTAKEKGDRDIVEKKEDAEYFRKILGRDKDGNCLIQDFYSANDAVQMTPVMLKKEECESWSGDSFEGLAVWYESNGEISNSQIIWMQNGEASKVIFPINENNALVRYEQSTKDKSRIAWLNNDNTEALEWTCDTTNHKPEQVIIFNTAGVQRFYFNENKIDPKRIVIWDEKGQGYSTNLDEKSLEVLQGILENNGLNGICSDNPTKN